MANKSPTHYLCTVKLSLLYLYKFLRYKNFKNKLFCGTPCSNGSFVGLTDDGLPTKTVLTFMVQSVCGSYKDVVRVVLINKLETSILTLWFKKVMLSLDKFF